MTVPGKLKTRTQQVVKVTSQVAVASRKKLVANIVAVCFLFLFGGIGVAYFLSAGPLGRLCTVGFIVAGVVILWFYNRPHKDQTLNWNPVRGYYTNSDPDPDDK